jgi:hypothetical protein
VTFKHCNLCTFSRIDPKKSRLTYTQFIHNIIGRNNVGVTILGFVCVREKDSDFVILKLLKIWIHKLKLLCIPEYNWKCQNEPIAYVTLSKAFF